jgi:hypothetical protein
MEIGNLDDMTFGDENMPMFRGDGSFSFGGGFLSKWLVSYRLHGQIVHRTNVGWRWWCG